MAQRECRPPSFTLAVLPVPGGAELGPLIAATRAGEVALVDCARPASVDGVAARLAAVGPACGVRVDAAGVPALLDALQRRPAPMVLLAGGVDELPPLVATLRPVAGRIFREVIDQAEAAAAVAAGVDGLVARGNECGGRVGTETTFVLLQRLRRLCDLPIWVQGGVTPNTLAACLVAGASGAVLDSQLALADEVDLPDPLRGLLGAMDGTETLCLGESLGCGYRVHRLRGAAAIRALQDVENQTGSASEFRQTLDRCLADKQAEPLWPLGQEAALAARLAARHRSVAGILRAYRRQAVDGFKLAVQSPPFGEGNAFAKAHGLRYPLFQGPMTRVSDVAPFADAVAVAGGLPFLALALLRETDTRKLLEQTKAQLGDRLWGVGLLAFIPPELRAEQMRAVLAVKPRFAILAGGRPDQAADLDKAGITTYLHTPSPRLLEMFLRDGARRFIFEGRECGGHVGPLSSFLLWDSVIDVLLRFRKENSDPIDVVFAGGIHDATSAAMVAALAAPAVEANIRVGLLMGTAYLFTQEAVASGAIVPAFQEAAIACKDTTLLDAQGGHAIRVVPTRYADEFNDLKRTLLRDGVTGAEAREKLEEVNLGRLRIASKGVKRATPLRDGPREELLRDTKLEAVSADEQRREGMYMIGSVAALHDRVGSIEQLHHDVCVGSSEYLRALVAERGERHLDVPIAVIGMACIFPDAPDLDTYWANILRLHNAIREVPPDRWPIEHFYNPDPTVPDRVVSKWGGFFAPVAFDPMRFGIPPASLPSIEPIQLLVLQNALEAIKHTGYDRRPFARDRTAVIIGAGGGACDLGLQYQTRAMAEHYLGRVAGLDPAVRQQAISGLHTVLPALTEDSFPGTLCNVVAGRIANRFDLAGPNFAVDAACASSLAALDMAVMELWQRTSDLAFLGGGDVQMNISSFLMFSKTHALSPSGRCRPFDAKADGIAISEGLAGVMLKRLDEAERDGDTIYAVIRSVGSASDGRDKSLTAPSLNGQKRTLERAYASNQVSPDTIGLVEAHGTGTVVGDRTELQALREVFEAHGAAAQSCALGSVKSQIGHTKNGAGLAGLFKAVMALHTRTLPPTLFEEPSPAVADRGNPFYLSARPRPWFNTRPTPRRAGLSAFGFGGTNFHVVLEEYAGHAAALSERPVELFFFRAATRADLITRVQKLDALLEKTPKPRFIDLAALCQREAAKARGDCRLAVVAANVSELRSRLTTAAQALAANKLPSAGPICYAEGEATKASGKVAFLFPGQGSQHLNMLEELALYFPIVRETFEQAERELIDVLPTPLTRVVFPPPAYTPQEEAEQRKALDQTWYAQPALGAADYAMHTLLGQLGVEPDMVAGHSYGEYVALCAAGALSFGELIRLSERRGRLVQETQGREAVGMIAVQASLEKLGPILDKVPGVAVAACNAPEQTVLGGRQPALDAVVPLLEAAKLGHQRLAVSAGFHIPDAKPAAEQFVGVLADVDWRRPTRQVWSNRTANVYPSDAPAIRQLLREHLTEPVRFRAQVEAMAQAGAKTIVEVGPGQVLSSLARQTLGERDGVAILATNRRGPGGALAALLECVGRLWTVGVPVRGERLFAGCEIRPLEVADLGKGEPPLSPMTWMVDGSTARPLKAAAKPEPVAKPKSPPPPKPIAPPPVAKPAATNGATNGTAAVRVQPPTQQPPTTPVSTMPPTSSSPAAEVMAAFQQSMRAFLEFQTRAGEQRQTLMQTFLQTQANIVQTYLTGQPAAVAAMPALAPPPVPAMPVPAMPVMLPPATNGTPSAPPPSPAPQPISAPVAVSEPPAPPVNGTAELVTLPTAERSKRLQGLLLELVSDRTGYPQDMLELDHNMEADLGIDSIKRTEIFGGLRDRLGFHGEEFEKEEYYIKLGKLRTLREVLAWLTDDATAPHTNGHVEPEPHTNGTSTNGHAHANGSAKTHQAIRLTLEDRPAPLLDSVERAKREKEVVLVTDGPSGRARKLFSLLRGLDYDLAFVRHAKETKLISAGNYEVDLLSPESVKQLRAWVEQHHGKLTTLCHLLPLDAGHGVDPERCLEVRSLFHLTSAFGLDLLKARGAVLGVTGMGGTFGVGDTHRDVPPGQPGVAGFLKSLAREWQDVHVKVVDVDPTIDDPQLFGQIITELHTADRKVEVGYSAAGRTCLDVVDQPVERSPEPMIELDHQSVVLVIGGARGITAAIAQALAKRHKPRLVLVGRSPLPEAESTETKGITNAGELKRVLADRRRKRGELVTPGAIETEFRSLTASRELQGNLDQLSALGAPYTYHSLDVRDEAAFTALLRSLYEQYGRLDGVLHAAGLLGDSLLVGKSVENFDRAFDTKIKPALVLARELRPETLRFLVFFSSVSARWGNVGQTDYAAANEVLNKLAGKLDRDWPARVVSIGWGPWDEVGMARPDKMSAEYLAAVGFAHMPVAAGCEQFLNEIAYGHKGDPEVLVFQPQGDGPSESTYTEAQFYLKAGKR